MESGKSKVFMVVALNTGAVIFSRALPDRHARDYRHMPTLTSLRRLNGVIDSLMRQGRANVITVGVNWGASIYSSALSPRRA